MTDMDLDHPDRGTPLVPLVRGPWWTCSATERDQLAERAAKARVSVSAWIRSAVQGALTSPDDERARVCEADIVRRVRGGVALGEKKTPKRKASRTKKS